MRKIMATLVAGIAVAATVATGPAAHAADNVPCGGQWWHSGQRVHVQTCPDWSPPKYGEIPVYEYPNAMAGARIVGYIDPAGDDWYVCGLTGLSYGFDGYSNNWWALTVADNGQAGYANQVYFQGGGNYESDANLRICPLPSGYLSGTDALARLRG
jgi:hypothetical protein